MIVGLYGGSRAGKDSIARFMWEDHGYQQRAMAARIREILLKLNPVVFDDDKESWYLQDLFTAYNSDWDEVKAVCRESVDYMIRLGQGCRDILGEDVWINQVLPEIGSDDKVVISDVRQPNEYDTIKERGGVIWHVVRSGIERRGMDGLLDGRVFDAVIYNDGTLEDLREAVKITLERM